MARVEPEGAPGPLHIGRPDREPRVRLLDAKGEPVAPGEIGEIHLGGIGLARGYLGDAAQTPTASSPDPSPPSPARASIGPAISRASCPTATSSTWAASTSR